MYKSYLWFWFVAFAPSLTHISVSTLPPPLEQQPSLQQLVAVLLQQLQIDKIVPVTIWSAGKNHNNMYMQLLYKRIQVGSSESACVLTSHSLWKLHKVFISWLDRSLSKEFISRLLWFHWTNCRDGVIFTLMRGCEVQIYWLIGNLKYKEGLSIRQWEIWWGEQSQNVSNSLFSLRCGR